MKCLIRAVSISRPDSRSELISAIIGFSEPDLQPSRLLDPSSHLLHQCSTGHASCERMVSDSVSATKYTAISRSQTTFNKTKHSATSRNPVPSPHSSPPDLHFRR